MSFCVGCGNFRQSKFGDFCNGCLSKVLKNCTFCGAHRYNDPYPYSRCHNCRPKVLKNCIVYGSRRNGNPYPDPLCSKCREKIPFFHPPNGQLNTSIWPFPK